MFEHNGYKYYSDKETLLGVKHDKNTPTYLYKYYSLSENSVNALTQLYVYASHPAQLNDPLDCNVKMIKFDDEAYMKVLAQGLYEQIKFIYENEEERMQFYQTAYQYIIYSKCGILSMAENDNNINLWATYTNNEGFCVEFDFAKFGFKFYGPYPINYSDSIKPVKLSKVGVREAMAYQTNVKTMDWAQEKEWRIIIPSKEGDDFNLWGPGTKHINNCFHGSSRCIKYQLCAIKSIILAYKFFSDDETTKISDTEKEVCIKNELKNTLIDFVIRIGKPIKIVEVKDLNSIKVQTIKIIKLGIDTYRIICNKTD